MFCETDRRGDGSASFSGIGLSELWPEPRGSPLLSESRRALEALLVVRSKHLGDPLPIDANPSVTYYK